MCPAQAGEDTGRALPGLRLRGEPGEGHLGAAGDRGPASKRRRPRPQRLDTPGVRTIEDLATGYELPADRQIKTLVEVIDGKLTLVLLRGDHPLSDQKLIDATGATAVRPAQPEEIREALGAPAGQPRRGRRDRRCR